MADQPITTSIDDLVKYLNEHGETDSATLSTALKVNENIIETWADALEKGQIVKVSYKLGRMYISPMVNTKEGVQVAKKTVELKRDVAEAELVTQVNMINQVSAKLEEFRRYVTGAEGAFKTKAGEIKGMIDEIDRLNAQVDASYKRLRDKNDYITSLTSKLESDTQKLEEKAKAAETLTGRENDVKVAASGIKEKIDDSESRLRALNAEYLATMKQNERSFAELLNGIREQTRQLRELLNQREREAQEYYSSINSYRQESESVRRQVAKEKAKMTDDIARSTEEARKVYTVAEKQIIEAKKALLDLKGEFGGFAVLNNSLNGIKSSIDAIEKQKDEIQKELNELAGQLKALSAVDKQGAAEKSLQVERIEKKLNTTAKKVDTLKNDTDGVKKGIDNLAK